MKATGPPLIEILKVAFKNDIESENFQLDMFMKDQVDIDDCIKILEKNFDAV